MKLRLNKSLRAAVLAYFFAVASSAVQAASIEYSTYSDAQKNGLVYANSFSGTVDFDTTVVSGTGTVGLFGDSSGFSASDGVGSLTGRMRTNDTVVSGTNMFANGSGFTVSMDLTNVTITNWKDLISFGSPGGTMELQSNANNQLMLYTNSFAGCSGLTNAVASDSSVDTSEGGTGMMYRTFDPGTTLTVVYDASNALFKAYLNGTEAYSANLTGANKTVTVTGITLGGNYSNTDRNIGTDTTKLDNLAIWNRALSATEVTSLIYLAPGADITEGTSFAWSEKIESSLREVAVRVEATPTAGDRATLTITADENISIDSLKVTGGALGLDVAQDGSFTTGELTIGSNANFVRSGKGALTIGTLTMSTGSTLTVAAGSTLALGEDRTTSIPAAMGEGTEFSSSGETRTYTVEERATLTDNRFLKLTGGTLNVNGGGTVEVFGISLSANGSNASTVNIAEDTTMHIFGTSNDASAGNKAAFGLSHWGAANEVNVRGTLISDAGLVAVAQTTAAVNVKDGGKFIMTNGLAAYKRDSGARATINVEDGGTLSVGSNANNYANSTLIVNMADGSTIEAYAADSIVGQTLTLSDGTVNFKAADSKKLTIKSVTGTADINVKGAGTVAMGDLTLGGITVDKGSKLSLDGEVTVGKTITNNGTIACGENGKLILGDLSNFTLAGDVTYSQGDNGFANASYLVIKADAENTSTLDGLTKVTASGQEFTLRASADNTKQYIDLTGDHGTYYINSGEVSYADGSIIASAATTGIELRNGTLALNKALAEGVGIITTSGEEGSSRTVSIAKGVALDKGSVTANGSVELSGAGSYTIGAAIDLPTNVSLASDWTGTVVVDGFAFGDPANGKGSGKLNNLANANSNVGLTNCTGWISPGGTIAANLKLLTGDAITLADGSPQKQTFSGKITGDGNFVIGMVGKNVNNASYVFSGDVSGWEGTFKTIAPTGKSFNLEFSGTSDIGASVDNGANITLNVTISGNAARTMKGSISGEGTTNLTVSGTGTKTFTGAVDVNDATFGGGAVTMASLSLSGTGAVNTDVTVTGDTALTTTSAKIAIASEKTLKTGNGLLSITGTEAGTQITTSAANATVNTSNSAITIANADITVNSATDYDLNATLSQSTIANKGAGKANVKVDGTTNTYDASKGDVKVDSGTNTAKAVLTGIGENKSIEFSGDAELSGNAELGTIKAAEVTVAENKSLIVGATTIDGNVNVSGANSGKLIVSAVGDASDSPVLSVSGNLTANTASMTLTSTAVGTINAGVAGLNVGDDPATFLIAKVGGNVTFGNTNLGEGVYTLSADDVTNWQLTNMVDDHLVTYTLSSMNMMSGEKPLLVLSAQLTSTLTATGVAVVGEGSGAVESVLDLDAGTLKLVLNDVTAAQVAAASGLQITIGGTDWDAIVGENPRAGEVTLSVVDGTNTAIDLTGKVVSINGYVGESNGKYDIQFIPEPATGTLSVLALAALAARRRRKH